MVLKRRAYNPMMISKEKNDGFWVKKTTIISEKSVKVAYKGKY